MRSRASLPATTTSATTTARCVISLPSVADPSSSLPIVVDLPPPYQNLSAPAQFRSKEISKASVVDDMVASNSLLYKPLAKKEADSEDGASRFYRRLMCFQCVLCARSVH